MKTFSRRSVMGLLTVFGIAPMVSGCQAFWNALPTVYQVISTAIVVLDQIEAWVNNYFQSKPDATLQAKIAAALQKTRDALLTLENAVQGAKDIHDANVTAALAAFQAAYQALLDLVAPVGVTEKGKASAVPGEHLEVPPAKSFTVDGMKS